MFSFIKNIFSEPVTASNVPQEAPDENETAFQYAAVVTDNDIFGMNDMANGGDLDQFFGSSTAHLQYNPDDDNQPF